jgi:hypothetical protein
MASAKRTPRVSRISRGRTVAYARKQKSTTGGEADGAEQPASDVAAAGADDAAGTPDAAATGADDTLAASDAPPASPDGTASPSAAPAAAPSAPGADASAASPASIEPPSGPPESAATTTTAARTDATAPEEPRDATRGGVNGPALPGERGREGPLSIDEPVEPVQARVTTDRMPTGASIGAPPAMPAAASTPSPAGAAEDPTRLPGPREIPDGHPDDPAAPPGRVPRGDSRSLRRRIDRHEFALVYRSQTYVISRVGVVGTRGQWRVVEYPTPSMASHAYAKECSRFVSDGFSDYRE